MALEEEKNSSVERMNEELSRMGASHRDHIERIEKRNEQLIRSLRNEEREKFEKELCKIRTEREEELREIERQREEERLVVTAKRSENERMIEERFASVSRETKKELEDCNVRWKQISNEREKNILFDLEESFVEIQRVESDAMLDLLSRERHTEKQMRDLISELQLRLIEAESKLFLLG
jgi:hypothetical protein